MRSKARADQLAVILPPERQNVTLPFTIDRSRPPVVRIVFNGLITADALESADRVLAPEGHFTDPCRLWDLRGCRIDISSEQLRARSEAAHARDRLSARVAALVDRDLHFGLGRMVGVFRSSPLTEFEVFRDEEKAIEWLLATEAAP